LDFYHAVEKLSAYATLTYKNAGERSQWLDVQKQRLKADEVEKVVEDLKNTTTKTNEADKVLNDVIRYYENNIDRMK
jgi:membrane-bound lytic murein transglycosylase MltF